MADSGNNTYLVDTNFFIQAHRAYYPFDIFINFWDKIIELAREGSIISIDKVRAEIDSNDDALKNWCHSNLPDYFFKPSDEIMSSYASIIAWANSKRNHYLQRAIDEFCDYNEADAFLVAYGLHNNIPLITQEKSEPNAKKKIKIPEPCNHFNVEYCNTIEMFRSLNVTI